VKNRWLWILLGLALGLSLVTWIQIQHARTVHAGQMPFRDLATLLGAWGAALGLAYLAWSSHTRKVTSRDKSAQEQLLRSVMDAATDIGLIATDPSGLIQLFSRGAEKMLGLEAQDVIHRLTPEAFHVASEVEERGQELSEALGTPIRGPQVFVALPAKGLSETRNWTYRHADGHCFPVSLAVSALRDGEGRIFGYLGVARDIQAQQARESKLESEAREALENARLKSSFLSTMSHEIRTPMNAISAMSRYLLTTELDAEQREITEIGRKATRNLLEMLDRVLDLSKAEAGQLDLVSSPFSPIGLTRDCAELWRADATAKSLSFLLALPFEAPPVLGDAMRLRQVLNNLLGNALKFTTQGSITLRLQVRLEGELANLRWSVEDTGPGMGPEVLHRLFRPFTQADESITRQFGGTGLGLALSRELTTLMGGQLTVESQPEKGSIFTLEIQLPVA